MAVKTQKKISIGTAVFFAVLTLIIAYFAIAAVQGDFGHLRRIQIEAEETRLTAELAALSEQRQALENKNLRMSDEYLDLDLLDEQARRVLGMARVDEVILY